MRRDHGRAFAVPQGCYRAGRLVSAVDQSLNTLNPIWESKAC
jgi:hypothetical protein